VPTTRIIDANEATAQVAFKTNEVVAIYPITPASPMGEHADAWAARRQENIWGTVPKVVEMQSEGGAAGAVHGALQAGALTTTFTASQGLLLMLPNLYKIAGELTPMVLHVAARSVATHALSIFGDHSDIYACRQAGWGMLASNSPQEAHDLALISTMATLHSRIPFVHFFDGFRTSHELNRVTLLDDADIRAMIDDETVTAHRARALTPDRPMIRGTAQNPDVFFQAREAATPFYTAAPDLVEAAMDRFAEHTGRSYKPFEYYGHPEAERVAVLMGSGVGAAQELVEHLVAQGEKVGVLVVRLFRPFSAKHFMGALPKTVTHITVLDRTKEPGSVGEPLYQDVVTTLFEASLDRMPKVVGGRYGLSSKEFTPAMIKGVFEALTDTPKNHFTVGIIDDVSYSSLPWDPTFSVEPDDVVRAVFYGLGSDGTVGANKNSIKIIGEGTGQHAQGYFVYDSKKSGAMTTSHLRFGPNPIRSTYLIDQANFVACHQWSFVEKVDMLSRAMEGGTFLLNSPHGPDEVWAHLPREVQATIIEKSLKFWVLDAATVAREAGLGRRINTIMQTGFFKLSGVLPEEQAIAKVKEKIRASYGLKGDEVVRVNIAGVDAALAHMHQVTVPAEVTATFGRPALISEAAPDFVQKVTAVMIAGHGDLLPVSAFPPDGTFPTATTQWEKRAIAPEIPEWDASICIQCNKCAVICPHAAIRVKVYGGGELELAPETFKATDFRGKPFKGQKYTVQVAPEDCTGCGLCVEFCPAKDKRNPRHKAIDMEPMAPLRAAEKVNYDFFLDLPEVDVTTLPDNVKSSQFRRPLFEYSGACSGCGETPYIKLLSQLFGDRALIANATGCSSIFGGNLPSTPYCTNDDGRGPAWANSLFEDNAEFGLGFRLAVDALTNDANILLAKLAPSLDAGLVTGLSTAEMTDDATITAQRDRVVTLKAALEQLDDPRASRLLEVADYLVRKSVWIVGGDGWAYDIGYGGLDHVLASDANVNILVLDTEVYSNTGGQASKATPKGAVAKFAADGKSLAKKDLGVLAMMHDHVYVAHVAIGAKDAQTYKAFVEAEAWPGPSLIIAYSPCIAHGYDLKHSASQSKLAVETGYWPLYRFDPMRTAEGKPGLVLDSKTPKGRLLSFAQNETRFRMLMQRDPTRAKMLMEQSETDIRRRFDLLVRLAKEEA
jgi:pyruvate-ferredoxin/flavodoxin oxidoreductase